DLDQVVPGAGHRPPALDEHHTTGHEEQPRPGLSPDQETAEETQGKGADAGDDQGPPEVNFLVRGKSWGGPSQEIHTDEGRTPAEPQPCPKRSNQPPAGPHPVFSFNRTQRRCRHLVLRICKPLVDGCEVRDSRPAYGGTCAAGRGRAGGPYHTPPRGRGGPRN